MNLFIEYSNSKEEALKDYLVDDKKLHDYTKLWNKLGLENTDENLLKFCEDNYIEGEAGFVTIIPSKSNTKKYSCNIKINPRNYQKFKRYLIVTDEEDKIIIKSKEGKAEVKKLMRDLYKDKNFKSKLKANYVYCADEDENIIEAEYKPTKGSGLGTYLIFY